MAVEVGSTAPNFTLYDTDKNRRSLAEFKGKNVVLAFFPGAFTGLCTKEMCTFQDDLKQFDSLNCQVIGITVDSPFAQKEWTDKNNIDYPFLSDFNRQVVSEYDLTFQNLAGLEGYVSANRAVVVVDPEGIVKYKWIAPNPGVEPDYDEIRTAVKQ